MGEGRRDMLWPGFGVGDEENWNEHGLNEGGTYEGGKR
jgi:hypothetical protein